jgi:hypothetical protein
LVKGERRFEMSNKVKSVAAAVAGSAVYVAAQVVLLRMIVS